MMDVEIGQEGYKMKALVDTGAELNIIPEIESNKAKLTMRALNMHLKGIEGHSTKAVVLSEITLLILPSGEERKIQFFAARGAFNTLISRPFLADNVIILEHCHNQGEILSYSQSDSKRLCIPIFSPEEKAWHSVPLKGMELCNMVKASD
ncbi:hypothetical protein O181_008163 [Austropuccinia psidii MF-1]|uniref:Peptidase A2 domain-containing protein n=1 Tax=Austropuccinia psidii MF-1 TaxID=1389203 RepID=A0A9Q3BNV5_9BASI|nr:hypothetical protein [Austropuccinia psidii MF-1]